LGSQPQFFVHEVLGGQTALAANGLTLPVPHGSLTIGICDSGVQAIETTPILPTPGPMDFYPNQILTGLCLAPPPATGNIDSGDAAAGGFAHGSFCSGIMAAATNTSPPYNGAGFVPGALIDPVDLSGKAGTFTTMSVIQGIKFLQNEPGVRFINLSANAPPPFSFNTDPAYLHAVAIFSKKKDGAVFNAAGNDGMEDTSPPYYPFVHGLPVNVVISAVNRFRNLAFFSNFGASVCFAGVGVEDGSTVVTQAGSPPSNFIQADGTSFSTPSCCAIAAALQYAHPDWTWKQIFLTMAHNCIPCGIGHSGVNNFGFGLPSMGQCIKHSFSMK
jgi:hypothetical protein